MAESLDPITFEVLKHRLWQINDEQAIAIKTISASPIVVEGNDFNTGLFTADGRLVIAGFGSTVHVGTMGSAIKGLMEAAGPIREGDVLLTNDPFLGALHQNDVIVASPFYWEGEPVLWVGNVLHHPDVGGIDEGSFCINARNLYQEPPRYLLKIVEQGEWSVPAERTFTTNSRLPEMVGLDLKAQVASIHVAKTRLAELLAEVGWPTLQAVMEQSLSVAAQQIQARLAEIPDGRFSGVAYMDGDRVGSDRILTIRVALEKRGGRLRFDYTGTDPQVDAAVNCTEPALWAATAVPLYAFLCGGEIDWNDALRACMEVVVPPGTVVSARFPAPVSISTVGCRWLATVAAGQAVAKMLSLSPRYQDRAVASWNVSSHCVNLFGSKGGLRVGALLSDHRGGGAAARAQADGISHAGQVTSYASFMGNVEEAEWKLPVLYLTRYPLPDSGGAGRWRGGLTAASVLTPYGADPVVVKVTNTAGTEQTNALGLWGGWPGAGSLAGVIRQGCVASDQLWPSDPWVGRGEVLPSKADLILRPGDVLWFFPPGGGGWGDPLDRNPEWVADDVRDGRVSAEWARRLYGVATSDTGVDWEATARLRSARRRDRLASRSVRLPWQDVFAAQGGWVTVGEYGYLSPHGALSCRRCGASWDEGLVVTELPIGAAGPWRAMRWGGESPQFRLLVGVCPGCGTAVAVTETLCPEGR